MTAVEALPQRRPTLRRATAGALAAAVALASSVLLDGLSTSIPSMVLSVGQAVIRWSPGSVARGGVETFGTADKPLLVAGIVVLSIAIGARAGTARRDGAMPVAMLGFGLLGAFCAVQVADAPVLGSILAAMLSAAGGIVTFAALAHAAAPTETAPIGSAVSRRRFLTAGAGAAGGAAVLAVSGRSLLRTSAAEQARAGVELPVAGDGVPPVPAGASLDVAGITPLVTPNRDFYRIDEALLVPAVDPERWRLRVSGMVDHPLELTYDELLARPMVERHVTLTCVSNEVGGGLIGTARWLGFPLASLLDEAGVDPDATQVVGRSVDGFTVGFPVDVARDGRDALIAVGMNGEPLPRRHGFPARLVVPGLYGYVSATKWLTEIELTTFERFDAYWIERGWAPIAPIKTQSRIDVPRQGASVAGGTVAVAGVAWAPHRGISAVDVRVDGGEWRAATLADDLSDDTWRQWHLAWDATPGRHQLEVRATDGTGTPQDEEERPPFPDGATGYHRVVVSVA